MTSRLSVLVTDAEQRAALAVVRSLGHGGHRVYVCASRPHALAGASRYAIAEAVVADPFADPGQYVRDLRALAAQWSISVMIPISDASLLAILPHRAEFGDVMVPFSDVQAMRRIPRTNPHSWMSRRASASPFRTSGWLRTTPRSRHWQPKSSIR